MTSALLALSVALPLGASAENATWLHRRWWSSPAPAERVAALARHLEAHGVRWVFVKAGGLRPRAPEAARGFVAALRAAAPGVKILPWVSAYAHRHLGRGPRWTDRTAARLARLVRETGADGIHLDIEPPFGSFGQIPGARLAALAAALRRHAPEIVLSFALHPLRTESFPRGLDPAEVRPLLAVVDQVAVMMYDTAIADPAHFRRAIAEQVEALGGLAEEVGRARLWMGAAAYPRHGRRFRRLHDPAVENVALTAAAFRDALRTRPHAARWAGLALFAHYSARPEDWTPLR